MALRLADAVEAMKGVIAAPKGNRPRQRCGKVMALAADFLVKALARDEERGIVAILMLMPENDQLTFAYPTHLARGNTLPVDRDSIAGRVVLSKQPVVENDVPNEPHKGFFERIPDQEGSVRPIQKMIAAPFVSAGGEVIGVVEISRTGSTPAAAGPDFSPQDGDNLGKCCRAFAPFIARTWTEMD